MLRKSGTWQHIAVASGAVFLGGCSYFDLFDKPKGVTAPQPFEIAQYVAETETTASPSGLGHRVTAGEYLIAALSYTNERCHAFFDTLERFRDDNSLFGKVLDAAAAAGTPLLGYASGSADALRFATALTVGKQVNTSLGEIYAYVAHRDQLKRHVLFAMADFRRVNGLNVLSRSLIGVNEFSKPTSKSLYNPIYYEQYNKERCSDGANYEVVVATADATRKTDLSYQINECRVNDFLKSSEAIHLLVARNIATEYASLCSLSHLKSIIGDALSNTQTKVEGSGSSATSTTGKATENVEEANAAAATAIDAAHAARAAARDSKKEADKSEASAMKAQQAAPTEGTPSSPPDQ